MLIFEALAESRYTVEKERGVERSDLNARR